MPNPDTVRSLYAKRRAEYIADKRRTKYINNSRRAEHFQKENERLMLKKQEKKMRMLQESYDASITLLRSMKQLGLPASVRVSRDLHDLLRWRPLRPQNSARKAFLERLAYAGGVPARKVRFCVSTPSAESLPVWQIEIRP